MRNKNKPLPEHFMDEFRYCNMKLTLYNIFDAPISDTLWPTRGCIQPATGSGSSQILRVLSWAYY